MAALANLRSVGEKLDNFVITMQEVAVKLENIAGKLDSQTVTMKQIYDMTGQGQREDANHGQRGVLDTWMSSIADIRDAMSRGDNAVEKGIGILAILAVVISKLAESISIYEIAMRLKDKFSGKSQSKDNGNTATKLTTMADNRTGNKPGGIYLPNGNDYKWKPIGQKTVSAAKSSPLPALRGPNSIQLPSHNLMAYSSQMPKAAKAVDGLTRSQRMLNTVMNANPIGRLIQLGILLYENWDAIKAVLGSVWAKFQETFPGLAKIVETYVGAILEFWTQLPGNILSALSGVYEIITGAFRSAFAWLSEKFNWVQGVWNGLFGDGGKNGGAGSRKVHSNARGGIVMQPILTTFAEAGPEAAIPLDGSSRAVSLWYTAGRMLGMFDESRPALGAALPIGGGNGAGGGMVVSAPVNITINGNADSHTVRQIQQAAQAALLDLKRQLQELQRQERRVSFV